MSSKKNNYDTVQYTVRLNLNKPEHLAVHRLLMDLNTDTHKSRNLFIIESILRNSKNYSDEEIMTDAALDRKRREAYITIEDFEKYKEELKKEILSEVVSIMFSSLMKSNNVAAVNELPQQVVQQMTEESTEVVDETLKELSAAWA